jgi:hypothetical protein
MSSAANHLDTLQTAIQLKYQCKATYRETVFVHEKMENDETMWKGYVEVFDLTGRPEAQTCYAWRHTEMDGIKIFTVLGNKIVNSAQRAIQAAIFVNAQPTTHKFNDLQLLKRRIEDAKKYLHETEIKVEDLDAIIQASMQNREYIKQRRKPSL